MTREVANAVRMHCTPRHAVAPRAARLLVWTLLSSLACTPTSVLPDASDASREDATRVDTVSDAGTDVSRDDARPDGSPPVTPAVWVAQVLRFGPFLQSSVTFSNITAQPDERCGQHRLGTCVAIDCREGANPVRLHGANAGAVSVGPSMGDPYLSEPDLDNVYPFTALQGVADWSPNDRVTFTANGGADIPAFTESLLFPEPVQPLTPVQVNAQTPYSLARDRDLVATWTPTGDSVIVEVIQTILGRMTAMSFISISCTFDGTTGTGTVPASLLDALAPSRGSEFFTGVLTSSARIRDITPGGWPVRLQVQNSRGISASVP